MQKIEDTLDFLAVHTPEVILEGITTEDVLNVYKRYNLNIKASNRTRPTTEEYEITKAVMRYEWAARMLRARDIVRGGNERN